MELHGILPLLKPKGMTSHDCVFRIRKLLKMKKVGHTGTLDPDVTGVLPICIGKATKIVEYMTDYPKEYIGEVTLGYSTTTEDSSGDILEEKEVGQTISKDEIEDIFATFIGENIQIPPLYSAVKVQGKRLYEYAREGIHVERPKRKVQIYKLQLLNKINYSKNNASFSFLVLCSKGTYIRTLAVDIGKKLGYPAHMSYLQRTASGPFTLEDCFTFEQVEEKLQHNEIENILFPIEKGISHFPKVTVNEEIAEKIRHGAVIPSIQRVEEERFSVYNKQGECLAIYGPHPTKIGMIKPERMLLTD